MKDITPADASRLRETTNRMPKPDQKPVFLSSNEQAEYERLLAQGLLRIEKGDNGYDYYRLSERGATALACHEALKQSSGG